MRTPRLRRPQNTSVMPNAVARSVAPEIAQRAFCRHPEADFFVLNLSSTIEGTSKKLLIV
jgi:hypothetical protein